MNKLIIVRHGESIGNASNIIQGKNNNYGLTNDGKKSILLKTKENLGIFKCADRIIVSPYKRTAETAEIISKETKLPVFLNENIEEMDAGILSGIKKESAKKDFPEYYEIWKNREDLDRIPNAETGEELQARVIGFLMQYYDKQEFCDVVVTHAGFLRSLVNTIENRERTFNFPIENGAIFQMQDIFRNLNIEKKDRAMNSKVLIINTVNGRYVVKLKTGELKQQDYAEKELLEDLKIENVPKILSMQNYEDNRYCKVIKHIRGEHKYGKLTDAEYNALIDSEYKLSIMLRKQKNKKFNVSNLKEIVKKIYLESKNEYIKTLAKKILNSKYSLLIENVDDYVLSHNDLNRDNILFEETEKDKVKANIIDFESLEYAPKDFQFASMLASGLLLEGESLDKIEKTICEKNKNLEKILYLMQIRTLEGLHFFADNMNIYSSNNKQASIDLLKRYFYASEKIQMEMNRINGEKELEL